MKTSICLPLITSILSFILSFNTFAYASSWYDKGSHAAKDTLDLDFPLTAVDMIDNAQNYIVWGYGNAKQLNSYDYLAPEFPDINHVDSDVMHYVISNDILDFSSTLGSQYDADEADLIFSQIYYTLKLPHDFDIVGNSVVVFNSDGNTGLDMSFDIVFRIPIPRKLTPSFLKQAKIVIGGELDTDKEWSTIYSLDVEF